MIKYDPDPPGQAPGASGAGNPGERMPEIVSRQPTEEIILPLAHGKQDHRGPAARPGGSR